MKVAFNALLAAMVTLGAAALATATPPPDHKVFWCHYPPGRWSGNPLSSGVLILSIDRAAIGGHLGHSPIIVTGPGTFIFAEGETASGDPSDCPQSSLPPVG